MATLTTSQLPSLREDGGLFRELDVLKRLRLGLPDGYEIFHGGFNGHGLVCLEGNSRFPFAVVDLEAGLHPAKLR
jgi:hypothetical protein